MAIPKIYESREEMFDLYRSSSDVRSCDVEVAVILGVKSAEDGPFLRVARDLEEQIGAVVDEKEELLADLLAWPKEY